MYVIKRSGKLEEIAFDKITERIRNLSHGLNVEPITIAQATIATLSNEIKTSKIDTYAADICMGFVHVNPDYSTLAVRILISNLQKESKSKFSESYTLLYNDDAETHSMIGKDHFEVASKYFQQLDEMIVDSRDYDFDYFGFNTLRRSHLKETPLILERPQYMYMRVALQIHINLQTKLLNLKEVQETYDLLSLHTYTHATPTLFQSCGKKPQLASCFLTEVRDDSIEGIYKTLADCASISKTGGGIGLSVTKIRSSRSNIRSTNGTAGGLIPPIRVFDATARYVDQSGKRSGGFAVYCEPWHADFRDFLMLKRHGGTEYTRARGLFYGVWANNLLFERSFQNLDWSFFDPHDTPLLLSTYGDEFKAAYLEYETAGLAKDKMSARQLMFDICNTLIETGDPYILNKDEINLKSNQKNIGMIKLSNLCAEIVEHTNENEIAVCTLASISLPHFYNRENNFFDFDKLIRVTRVIVRNLNKIIDANYYALPEAKNSNLKHRPMGIGIQGLGTLFAIFRYCFDSVEAADLNRRIIEHIYFAAITESVNLAKTEGPYETFAGSPASQGILSFDMWNETPITNLNWSNLKIDVMKFGMRNSLLVSLMPTASTSQILGNTECFEPYTSNIYVRRVVSGEYIVTNPFLVADLQKLGLWNKETRESLILEKGSVQNLRINGELLPEELRKLYRTVYEIPQKCLIDLAASRAPFVCQTQSMNLYKLNPSTETIYHMLMYGWSKKLKTLLYYLTTNSAANANVMSIDNEKVKKMHDEKTNVINEEALQMCRSKKDCELCSA